jgi:hypothetical protein
MDPWHIAIQGIVTVAAAIGVDWALQFRIKLAYGVETSGERAQHYRFGPWHKVLLMMLYLVPLNWTLVTHRPGPMTAFLLVAFLFLIYMADAALLTIRMMQEGSTES